MNAACSNVETTTIEPDAVSKLLELSLSSSRCWVEVLKDLVAEPEGGRWLERTLARGPVGRAGEPRQLLLAGVADVDLLRRLKSECKTAFHDYGDDDDRRIIGIAGYFFTLVAALAHHRTLLSRQPRTDVGAVLGDLAIACPDDWGRLVERAAEAAHKAPLS
jgi:hypothetical protein